MQSRSIVGSSPTSDSELEYDSSESVHSGASWI